MKFPTLIIYLLLLIFQCDISIEQDVKSSKFIVLGEVAGLSESYDNYKLYPKNSKPHDSCSFEIKFRILENLKGNFEPKEIIFIKSDFSDSSIFYKYNDKYILFLDAVDKKKRYYRQRKCSHSGKVENSKQLIEKVKDILSK